MRFRQLAWLLFMGFVVAIPSRADTASVYVNGSVSSWSYSNGNYYGIGPYGGTLNGSPAQFYCVDFRDNIQAKTGWTALVTGLSSTASFNQTILQSETTYMEMAWLVTKMTLNPNNPNLDAQLQWAIWYLSLGSVLNATDDPYQSDAYWASMASGAVSGGWTTSGWEILTPDPLASQGGYGQEFLVPDPPPGAAAPEPSTFLLLCAGLIALVIFSPRK